MTMTEGTVRSADGTTIAYTRRGSGPAIILVDGALCSRTVGVSTELAELLAGRGFTTFAYDRRGRGGSGDTAPYAVAREVEDVAAVVAAAGGQAALFGISSGGALALEAAATLDGVTRVVVYEVPCIVDGSHAPHPAGWVDEMEANLAAGRRGAVVKSFLRFVGMPAAMVAVFGVMPPFRKLKAVAHTLPYDLRIIRPLQQGAPLPPRAVAAPVLVLDGGKSPQWMRTGNAALAAALGARHETLPGQTHMIKAKALAPVVADAVPVPA